MFSSVLRARKAVTYLGRTGVSFGVGASIGRSSLAPMQARTISTWQAFKRIAMFPIRLFPTRLLLGAGVTGGLGGTYIYNQLPTLPDFPNIDKIKEFIPDFSSFSLPSIEKPDWDSLWAKFQTLKDSVADVSLQASFPPYVDASVSSEPVKENGFNVNKSSSSTSTSNDQTTHDMDFIPHSSDPENELLQLTRQLIEVRNILKNINSGDVLTLPAIVVVGSQSSGKSSVLEAIVGHEFLPKGNNMVTRRPLELTLVQTPPGTPEFAEFPQLGSGRLSDWSVIQRTLTDLNLGVPESECISDSAIDLRIYSPYVPDLCLVDLPGYIQVTSAKQPTHLKEKIVELCEKYLQPPNVILAVCAADVDLANAEALKAARIADPQGMRTIGVLTKLDLVAPNIGVQLLTQNEYPLQLGYIGVVCPPSSGSKGSAVQRRGPALKPGETESRRMEVQFFKQNRDHYGPLDNARSLPVPTNAIKTGSGRLGYHPSSQSSSPFYGDGAKGAYDSRGTVSKNNASTQTGEKGGRPAAVGIGALKIHLARVLDASMSSSLHGALESVAEKLEEARYEFKVHYDDRPVSSETYVADLVDGIKNRLRDLASQFGKPEIQKRVRTMLESRLVDLLAEEFWNEEAATRLPLACAYSPLIVGQTGNKPSTDSAMRRDGDGNAGSDSSGRKGNEQAYADGLSTEEIYWRQRLERARAFLTKSGLGRAATQHIVDSIMERIETLVTVEPLPHHPDARRRLLQFASELLRTKFYTTVDRVEDSLRPFKYELDFSESEWKDARQRAIQLLEKERDNCQKIINEAKEQYGSRKLRRAMEQILKEEGDLRHWPETKGSFPPAPPLPANANLTRGNGGWWGWLWGTNYAVPNIPPPPPKPPAKTKDASSGPGSASLTPSSVSTSNGSGSDSVNDVDDPSRPTLSPRLLSKARECLLLDRRSAMVSFRLTAIRRGCGKGGECDAGCPEVYLTLMCDKIAKASVPHVTVELLNEFFFAFPRDIDNRIYYAMDRMAIDKFARENVEVRKQLDLQTRRRALESAAERLQYMAKRQEERLQGDWR